MTPTPDFLRGMFDYMTWGDRLLVDAAKSVPDPAYYADRGFSLGSIHKLLVHGMAAQKIWLSRFEGVWPHRRENDTDHPTREVLLERWPAVHASLYRFLDEQTPATLERVVTGTNFAGQPFAVPLGQLMLHVVDHATYHRGQVNSMIKLAGGTPCLPFYQLFCDQNGRTQ